MRINPNNYAPSRQTFVNNIYLKNINNKNEYKITGLPSPLAAANISWSPNDKRSPSRIQPAPGWTCT